MSTPLKLKAEAVLAVQLVSRHRAVRLAAFLVLLFVALVAAGDGTPLSGRVRVALVVAGTLGAVAGSRLLAPGGALTAARMAAGAWWVAPVGRVAGAASVVVPVMLAGVIALIAPHAPLATYFGFAVAGAVYATSAITLAAVLAPVVGASVSTLLGLLAAWLGPATPSDLYALFAGVPVLRNPLVYAWNILPLPWRAARLIEEGTVGDAVVLAGWIGLGVLAAAWSSSWVFRANGSAGVGPAAGTVASR